jgi:GNAT superfamily N-acetyltransferase
VTAKSNQPPHPDHDLELVEIGMVSRRDWLELTDRDPAAFGDVTAGLIYRDKELHVGWRGRDGRLVAVLGLTVATVDVGGREPFDVVGMGSFIVRRDFRGRGLSRALSVAARERAKLLGPDRAMLFCAPNAVDVHRRRGYLPIEAPVRVDQPDGRIDMPIPAMWRPIRPSDWPRGVVEVQGLPF